GQESEAGKDEEHAHRLLDGDEMPGEALEETKECADTEGGKKERHAQPQGIYGEQERALPDTVLGRRDSENGGEHRPDARRPAEGEGKHQRISGDDARGAGFLPIALFSIEEGEAEEAQEMQAHEDDED